MTAGDRLSAIVARYTAYILAGVVLLTVLALGQLIDLSSGQPRLMIDPSTNRLLPEDDEAKIFYDYTRKVFGSDETLLIVLGADDVFAPDVLSRVERLTDRLGRIEEVHHVVSLSNALDIRGVEDGITIEPFLKGRDDRPEMREKIRARVQGNPVYAGSLVSKDSTVTALVVYFLDIPDREFIVRGIHDRIMQILEEERGELDVWVTGTPEIKAATTRALLHDLLWTPPIVAAVLAIILAITFRTVRGVVVPMATIFVGLIWTLGTIAVMGYSLNMVSALVPPLVMILGLSYSVHVVSEYHQLQDKYKPGGNIVHETFRNSYLPVVLAGLTTIAGFVALMLSPMAAIREFGLFAAIGVVYTTFLSVTFAPAMLRVAGKAGPGPAPQNRGSGDSLFDRMVLHVAQFDIDNRILIFVASFLVMLISIVGMTQIKVGTETIGNFSANSPVRKSFEIVNDKLGGANPFYIVIEGRHRDVFKEPENLLELQSLQQWLLEQPEIGNAVSLVDYLKLINQAFHDNDPAFHVIPESRRIITQLIFFSASDELEGFVEPKYQMANILVRSRVVDSDAMSGLVSRINERLEELPGHLKATITGNPILVNRTIDNIIHGQLKSVALALLIVYGILTAMFMSPRVGFLALVPNLMPIVVYFGALGIFGITLNPGTSLIAPMVLGIAIDDTIHYFARFNREVKRLADDRKATVSALKAVGRPVTSTSIALCLGFLVLMMSDLRMQVHVGLMASFALAVAWISDFFLTPALCSSVRIATLWDALTLDLGDNPQESIPMLKGLRMSQARIVALMANIYEVPAGKRIIHADEKGKEMFVVIEGVLRTSIDRKNGRIELATHSRGDVVGEAGLFHERRTADVDVLEDARLLRFTQTNLNRLARRYPFIATRVFRNLNAILAERLFKTTHRLV